LLDTLAMWIAPVHQNHWGGQITMDVGDVRECYKLFFTRSYSILLILRKSQSGVSEV
jgi:hypothetical protein